MEAIEAPATPFPDLWITDELDRRPSGDPDYSQQLGALRHLAIQMANAPAHVLPRFVDLAMQIADGVAAGISVYEDAPAPGVFRWSHLRGALSPFEGTTTPREFSPCGVALDQNRPVLSLHPERYYSWISEAGIAVPEVLLMPLFVRGAEPLGTLWVVSEREGHYTRRHADALGELSSFVAIALQMCAAQRQLESALAEQELLAKEMSHRVKNLFAIADGLIRAGLKSAPEAGPFAEVLTGRLHALAHAHDVVGRNLRGAGGDAAVSDFGALIQAILRPHGASSGTCSRVQVTGPEVSCGTHAVNAVALILHELATNSAKYGAFSDEAGSVEICWRLAADDVELIWTERGGPIVAGPPAQTGFGTALVNKNITGQLGGQVAYDWDRRGLVVTMTFPQTALRS